MNLNNNMNNKIKRKRKKVGTFITEKKRKRKLLKLAQFPTLICTSRTWIQIGPSIRTKPEREHVFVCGGFLCSDTIKKKERYQV
jgi:hypothetical protein